MNPPKTIQPPNQNTLFKWQYGIVGEGLVSGGAYRTTEYCSAYTLPPCNHYDTKNESSLPSCESGPPAHTPSCPTKCDNDTTSTIPFNQDRHPFSKAYAVPASELAIMTEIYTHGPVTAGFNVYSDWIHYPVGTSSNQVYRPQGGTEMGGHAIRIIGWNVSKDNVKYWIVANSFGSKWGINGYFYIQKGIGAAGIEESVVAGVV